MAEQVLGSICRRSCKVVWLLVEQRHAEYCGREWAGGCQDRDAEMVAWRHYLVDRIEEAKGAGKHLGLSIGGEVEAKCTSIGSKQEGRATSCNYLEEGLVVGISSNV